MIEKHLSSFIDRMSLALRQAGVVANALRGRVENLGKVSEPLETDSEILRIQRSAMTVVDQVIQEIILLAVDDIPGLGRLGLQLDAEEETPATEWFEHNEREVSLVIDPIDGTYEYLAGMDKYSICVGLVQKGKMLTALVYFPARNHLYFLDPKGQAQISSDAYGGGWKAAKSLLPVTAFGQHRIYKNGRLPSDLVCDLRKAGFEVYDDTDEGITCPDAILACISGNAVAYISHTRQMRDILLGAILAGAPTGYALDWSGEPLWWPSKGRVPRAVFGVGDSKGAILQVLKNWM